MKTITTVLTECQFLKGLPPESLEIFNGCSTNCSFTEHQLIFATGQQADYFYILRSGEVGLVVPWEHGAIEVQKLQKGDILGWSWMLPPYKWVMQARALSKVDAVKVDAKRLREIFASRSDFEGDVLKRLMPMVIQRLNALQFQLVDVYKAKTE